jgi:hypothetical protein
MASALRESVELEMRLRGFSPRTHESYIHALKELARFYWRPLETLLCDEVQAFLDHLITVRKLAWSTINVYFSAYRFLYEQVLKRSAKEFSIPPRGRSGTRPGILSPEEVERLVRAPANPTSRIRPSFRLFSGHNHAGFLRNRGGRVSKVPVVKTYPIFRVTRRAVFYVHYVFAMHSTEEGRQGTPLLECG